MCCCVKKRLKLENEKTRCRLKMKATFNVERCTHSLIHLSRMSISSAWLQSAWACVLQTRALLSGQDAAWVSLSEGSHFEQHQETALAMIASCNSPCMENVSRISPVEWLSPCQGVHCQEQGCSRDIGRSLDDFSHTPEPLSIDLRLNVLPKRGRWARIRTSACVQ